MGKKLSNTKIAELKADSGVTVTEPKELADYLNKHFAAISPNLASKIPVEQANIRPEHFLSMKDTSLHLKKVESSRVLKIRNKVNARKATGIDKISIIASNVFPRIGK